MTPVRLEPAAPLSPVKHTTTEPLRSPATFVVVLQFSQNNVFIDLACDRSAFWHRDLNSWTLISEEIAYKTFFTVTIRLAILGCLSFLVANTQLATFRFGSK